MPSLQRLLLPSMLRPSSRPVRLMPFSFCKLPTGTTILELVTSGRSVAMSSPGLGQPSARAAVAAVAVNAASMHAHPASRATAPNRLQKHWGCSNSAAPLREVAASI